MDWLRYYHKITWLLRFWTVTYEVEKCLLNFVKILTINRPWTPTTRVTFSLRSTACVGSLPSNLFERISQHNGKNSIYHSQELSNNVEILLMTRQCGSTIFWVERDLDRIIRQRSLQASMFHKPTSQCVRTKHSEAETKWPYIFQTTFSNAFSWMKIYEFRLRVLLSLFLRF